MPLSKKDLNNSFLYYAWWCFAVGQDYLPSDRALDLATKASLVNPYDYWIIQAAKLCRSYKDSSVTYQRNQLARKLGRYGENLVVQYLQLKGWNILQKPLSDLNPKYGTSTSGYDILACHGDVTIKIEVKTLQEGSPLWTIGPKCLQSIKAAGTDYVAFVKGDEIRFCAVKELVFEEPVYVHDAVKYSKECALVYLYVINPTCLRKAVINT